jgi:hypothetical protein
VTASQDRKRLGEEYWREPLNLVRSVFDLEVRRKPQAFAAVAVISLRCMDIECRLVIDSMLRGAAVVADDDVEQ